MYGGLVVLCAIKTPKNGQRESGKGAKLGIADEIFQIVSIM